MKANQSLKVELQEVIVEMLLLLINNHIMVSFDGRHGARV